MSEPTRKQERSAFLTRARVEHWDVTPLAGDASRRRYFRLQSPTGERRILMDAPRARGEDVRPYIKITTHLASIGMSVPEIDNVDQANGFILMEDLGDSLFSRVAGDDPAREPTLYEHAAQALLAIQAHPPVRAVPAYGPAHMAQLAALAETWYAPHSGAPRLARAVLRTLEGVGSNFDSLILRDYHAENLLWLPDRKGHGRVGLLDFQDASTGHRAYDLCSLLQDARRDVGERAKLRAREVFAGETHTGEHEDAQEFTRAYSALSAQRNLRILGVFARLALRDNKRHYLNLIPRVWRNLMEDLEPDHLRDLRTAVLETLPPPSEKFLHELRTKCATPPEA